MVKLMKLVKLFTLLLIITPTNDIIFVFLTISSYTKLHQTTKLHQKLLRKYDI